MAQYFVSLFFDGHMGGKIYTKYFTNPYKGHNSMVFYNMYYTTIIMHATLNSFLLIICQFWCSHLFAKEEGEVTLPIIHIFIHNCYPSRNSAAVMTQPRVTTHIHAYTSVMCSTSGSDTSTPYWYWIMHVPQIIKLKLNAK